MKNPPIGVFDSGVGGLTVLKEIQRALPGESTLYLGDSRRAPYGSLPPDRIIRFTMEAMDYLHVTGVKAVVIACNSATSVALEAAKLRLDVPVLGVIDPTARRVAVGASSGIGVIGTEATIRSGAYARAIKQINPEARVVQQACPALAGLVEQGDLDGVPTALAIATYLMPILEARVGTLVLGCTHYPFLRSAIQRILGEGVRLVESGPPLAADLLEMMDSGRLARAAGGVPVHRLTTTGDAGSFQRLASMLWPGEALKIEEVDIAVTNDLSPEPAPQPLFFPAS
ncbi:MAG: glutamate racemase [Chloroflexi bacterium]|nr:MAG: glutamate racemase [Chloroflexota bacterium]